MRRILPVAAITTLLACTSPKLQPEEASALCGPSPTQEEALHAVQDWVSGIGGLKDPSSAQVRNVVIAGKGCWRGGLMIDGGKLHYGWVIVFQVNAKNSYGGYVGYQNRWIIWKEGKFDYLYGQDTIAPPKPIML